MSTRNSSGKSGVGRAFTPREEVACYDPWHSAEPDEKNPACPTCGKRLGGPIPCPDCNARVAPVVSSCCRAITCTPSGGHYICEGLPGHGIKKGHAWRWRSADGVLKEKETPVTKAAAKRAAAEKETTK